MESVTRAIVYERLFLVLRGVASMGCNRSISGLWFTSDSCDCCCCCRAPVREKEEHERGRKRETKERAEKAPTFSGSAPTSLLSSSSNLQKTSQCRFRRAIDTRRDWATKREHSGNIVSVCACVRACVRACLRACVCVHVCVRVVCACVCEQSSRTTEKAHSGGGTRTTQRDTTGHKAATHNTTRQRRTSTTRHHRAQGGTHSTGAPSGAKS